MCINDVLLDIINHFNNYIKINDISISNKRAFKKAILNYIPIYSNTLNIKECKNIVNYYQKNLLELLKEYVADNYNLNELLNNDNIYIYKHLAKFIIFKMWFCNDIKLSIFIKYFNNNKDDSENEDEDETDNDGD